MSAGGSARESLRNDAVAAAGPPDETSSSSEHSVGGEQPGDREGDEEDVGAVSDDEGEQASATGSAVAGNRDLAQGATSRQPSMREDAQVSGCPSFTVHEAPLVLR